MDPTLLEPGIFLHPRPKKSLLPSQPPAKRRKTADHKIEEISFDAASRADYLTGFHKRKVQRAKRAREEEAKREREEKVLMRRQVSWFCISLRLLRPSCSAGLCGAGGWERWEGREGRGGVEKEGEWKASEERRTDTKHLAARRAQAGTRGARRSYQRRAPRRRRPRRRLRGQRCVGWHRRRRRRCAAARAGRRPRGGVRLRRRG